MVKEEYKDLFTVDFNVYTPAHCISLDCKMGAGIAVPMKRRFKLNNLISLVRDQDEPGMCIHYNGVYNLITKSKYYYKPTYQTLRSSLLEMHKHMKANGIYKIVMPKIGCGLDGLSWAQVREILDEIFIEEEVLVCHK